VCSGLADILQTPLVHMCYHFDFGHSKSNYVDISMVPKSWGATGPSPLRYGHGISRGNIKIRLFPTCVTYQIWSFYVKGCGKGYPQNWGALGPPASWDGTCLTPTNTAFPTWVSILTDHYWSNSTSVCIDIHQENCASRVPPFKVTQRYWN